MKSLKLFTIGMLLLLSATLQAQIAVNVNLGSAPQWGPVGYETVDYYYIPDVESYYDVRSSQFIYFGGGKWIRSRQLPRQYRNYDLYNGYKVVLTDYRGHSPYAHYNTHKVKYHKGYKGSPQRSIGHRSEKKLYNKGNHQENHKGNKGKGGHNKGKGNRDRH